MALWNDKRTPKGVVTDSRTGQSGLMGSSHLSVQMGARYAAPAAPSPTPDADVHRLATSQTTKPKPTAPVQNRQVKPRTAAPGKLPVDKPTNVAAAKGAAEPSTAQSAKGMTLDAHHRRAVRQGRTSR